MTATLETRALTKAFGGVRAVNEVSLVLEPGSILGLIGPNGSGKTTLLNMIAGTLKPSNGTILLGDEDITALPPHRKVARGITRTFQTTRVMSQWSVRESLALAGSGRDALPVALAASRVGVDGALDRTVGSLSSAEQRLVMVASALVANPKVLLLDEPAVGMDVDETDHLHSVVKQIRDEHGISVIIVEHNMRFLMSLADSVVVMASGAVLASGTPEAVRNNAEVVSAYLGGPK